MIQRKKAPSKGSSKGLIPFSENRLIDSDCPIFYALQFQQVPGVLFGTPIAWLNPISTFSPFFLHRQFHAL
jgi:hypothetical protein